MKTYTVYFNEPVTKVVLVDKFNKKTMKWEEVEDVKTSDSFTFYNLSIAKKFIKEHIDKYKGSCITKYWANGDWENLGQINLTGNNKTFVANTKQRTKSYN